MSTASIEQSQSSSSPTPYSQANERITDYLRRRKASVEAKIRALTPDASTRVYFRIPWGATSAVATVYPEPFDPDLHPFLDATRVLADAGLPVPEIYDVEGSCGVIVQEDLGDRQLYSALASCTEDEAERLQEQAVRLIAILQHATEKAQERGCIASRMSFDYAKLSWELGFFIDHYFGSLRGETLAASELEALRPEFSEIAEELAARPQVLCHRDYHAGNLMIDRGGNLRIIDYQDARMGPASYDLVSLLLDRQTAPPSLAEIRASRLFFLEERRICGLAAIDPDDFAKEFRLMTVQRCLKAVGTFSYQTSVCGRGAVYGQFIKPTLSMMLQASEWLNRFPVLQGLVQSRINDSVTV